MGRAIIADDDPIVLSLAREALVQNGFEVFVAKDGEAAVREASLRPPSVLVLDARMPVLDGFTALALLKQDARTRDIPVVMLTACRGPEDVRKARELGAAGYVAKPFSSGVLVSRVRAAVAQGALSVPVTAPKAAPWDLAGDAEYID